jgi:deoxyribodipyrimidine photolyase
MLLKEILNDETKSQNSGNPYKVFTPYMKYIRKTYQVKNPTKKNIKTKHSIDNNDINVKSGRKEAKKKAK